MRKHASVGVEHNLKPESKNKNLRVVDICRIRRIADEETQPEDVDQVVEDVNIGQMGNNTVPGIVAALGTSMGGTGLDDSAVLVSNRM